MGTQYRNILVAVDGSKEADWAFTKAVEIAKRNKAELSVVHVVDNRALATLTRLIRHCMSRTKNSGMSC